MENNILVLMGVCGCGKSTIGLTLKDHIEKTFPSKIKVSFIDGDDLHPESNKNKMKRGEALNDNDRKPWLMAIRTKIEQHNNNKSIKHLLVIACSALKYSYREILRGNYNHNYKNDLDSNKITFIMLNGTKEILTKRLNNRNHEYMDPNLLDSQLKTLEFPNNKYVENDIIIENIKNSKSIIVNNIIHKIGITNPILTQSKL